MDVELVELPTLELEHEAALFQGVVDMLATIWKSPEPFLRSEVAKTQRCVVAREDDGHVVGYASWGYHSVLVGEERHETAYLGLASIHRDRHRKGIARSLIPSTFLKVFFKLKEMAPEQSHHFVWGTLFSPVSWKGMHLLPFRASPNQDGALEDVHRSILPQLKERLGAKAEHDDPLPYVLRGYSKGFYREELAQGFERMSPEFPALDRIGLNHERGDRMIFTMSQ